MKKKPPPQDLTPVFLAALRAARQTYGDIAREMGYSSRILELYAAGERKVTREAAGRLMEYMVEHNQLLQAHGGELADALGISSPYWRTQRTARRKAFLAARASKE
jgi:hypothetical protein